MKKTLIVVESPNKCASIRKYLKNEYTVMASVGHIRDLAKKEMGIAVDDGFIPTWINDPSKKEVIAGLKKAYKESNDIIIMTDADSEGSAIGFHICEVLGIDPKKVKRATTLEITEKAVVHAVNNPGKLDMNTVDAAIGRRLLDRIFGFKISPLLWTKIKMGLSAGRVQSPGLRILCEREAEHAAFTAEAEYKVVGTFEVKDKKNKIHSFNAVLNKKFKTKKEAEEFLNRIKDKNFSIKSIEKKIGKKVAPAPFTTSAIQMECSRKFGMSPQNTMSNLQSLFSNGKTSYHRTDSTSLSEEILNAAEIIIKNKYGNEYSNKKQFTTKNKSAESAHEGIRPTHLEDMTGGSTSDEQKIYDLIYKRTLASQMSDAKTNNTIITIEADGIKEFFTAKGVVILFEGFLKLYQETVEDKEADVDDDSKTLPEMDQGQKLNYTKIIASQIYNKPSPRYSEASLIKELESLNIGRPSTYASIISVIQKREYCEKKDLPIKKRDVVALTLEGSKIEETVRSENYGGDKNKLIPTDIGMMVNQYLSDNFPLYVDYYFTAKMEESLDKICNGELTRTELLNDFYKNLIETIKKSNTNSTGKVGVHELGRDKISGKPVFARYGKYGPMVQLGESEKQDKKSKEKKKSDVKFAKLKEGQSVSSITLEEALKLLQYPKIIGQHRKEDILINEGKYGFYIKYKDKFYSLKDRDPNEITPDIAIEIIEDKTNVSGALKTFENGNIRVMNGKFGPYINVKDKNKNYKLPEYLEPEKVTLTEIKDIIKNASEKKKVFKRNY